MARSAGGLVARSLNNLGTLARQQGDLARAGAYHQRALAIRQKLAPNSLEEATSLHNLGNLAEERGDHEAAEGYHRRALAIQEKVAPVSPELAASLHALGEVAHARRDWAAARAHYERALTIKTTVAPDSLDLAVTLHQLGRLAQDQGNWIEAERWARQTWERMRHRAVGIAGDEARQAFGESVVSHAAALMRAQIALGRIGPAFATLEDSRAQALQQLLLERRLDASAAPEELWAAYRAAGAARDRAEQEASQAAVAEALARQIPSADVIHLATHGYLHPVRPMSSGLLLTVPEKEPAAGKTSDDGVLQAWEIYSQLKLKAELVVLSACETGRGQLVRSEGIVGLTRALQYAGARSIVASQWKVADESTRTLMVAFHRKLRAGLAKDEALRQAMALVRNNPKTAHFYYWGAFFLTGDPDNPNLGGRDKRVHPRR